MSKDPAFANLSPADRAAILSILRETKHNLPDYWHAPPPVSGRDTLATAEITNYAQSGYQLYAPGVIVAETLFVLCGKKTSGSLSLADYATAVATFERIMASVLPPPNGDSSLIQRAEQIGSGYGCSR
ncbi:MAG TPA: hypothetical protein VKU00_23975, partial [Chthonomonadaceae bacterium]|nr:hypothetical protein [Chthonomonadaceae bacterium]